MHNLKFTTVLLLGLGLFSGCSQQTIENKESTAQTPASPDRNMFGLHIPRGLTKTSENLKPGYVMFAVPNSSSMYLIDREGLVVHEWKGKSEQVIYGEVSGAYLNSDGSIIQQSYDMDFPVFAGGGEAGRLQRINWEGKVLWDFEMANEQHHIHHEMAVLPN